MGEMWDAMVALDKSLRASTASNFMRSAAAAEASMKLALARTMGLKTDPGTILKDYEIKMTLVKRATPLTKAGTDALKKLADEVALETRK